jgi:hypothetical protein
MRTGPLAVGVALAVAALACWSEGALAADAKKPSPDSYYREVLAGGQRGTKKGTVTAGEDFCWAVNYYLGNFVDGYEAYKDTAWLDAGVKSYDYAISMMTAGPDGYKGWVGPQGDTWSADVHVGDAVLMNHMLDFAELVLKDPALKAKYGEAANKYVELAKHDFLEKWISRGTWHEDGPYGGFVQWDMFCPIADTKHWQKVETVEDVGVSLPFNKQNDAGTLLLKLYRITGDKAYRDRAVKIFSFMKSRMLLAPGAVGVNPGGAPEPGDYYVWNYWEPLGPWDVDLAKKDTKLWMNVHGYRNYQEGEIYQIVEAYNTGVVFDKTDIQRIINTNLEVMWNHDKEHPKWENSNSKLPEDPPTPEEKAAQEKELATNVYAKEGRAGILWGALAQFSQQVRDIHETEVKQSKDVNPVSEAYFQNVVMKTPPSFDRKYASLPVTVFERPFHEDDTLTVACVLPEKVMMGPPLENSIVLCKARRNTELEVAVYSADGKDKKLVLFSGKVPGGTDGHAGIHILEWNGMDAANKLYLPAGDYRVRWTTPDGYREFPIALENHKPI